MKSMVKAFSSILLMFMLTFQVGVSVASTSAEDLVKKTSDDVLNIVKNDKDIQSGDMSKIYALAEEKILPNFDFDRVCQMVLGKNWRTATDAQKASFTKEFRSLLLRTYASALTKYRNQEIVYKSSRLSKDKVYSKVETEILQESGPAVEVGYTLVNDHDQWKVFDIEIANVSLVTNYRNQFGSEIRQNGLDSLIQKLSEKNKSAGL